MKLDLDSRSYRQRLDILGYKIDQYIAPAKYKTKKNTGSLNFPDDEFVEIDFHLRMMKRHDLNSITPFRLDKHETYAYSFFDYRIHKLTIVGRSGKIISRN